jgi:oxygen-dependent protoporphyrinogen oxidase
MPKTDLPRVIVIGAGIAGLAAAHVLTGAGLSVKVLEASGRVGGRMTTDRVNGFVVDRGAQFLSSEYSLLLSLAAELGLTPGIRETSPWSAVVRNGTIRRMRVDNPLQVLTSGLLGWSTAARFGWRIWQLRKSLRSLPLNDYSQWAAFDNETVSSWASRTVDQSVTEYLYEPMLQGFYFQAPEDTSLSLALVLSAFGFRRARTLTCTGGVGMLPEALASRLDVVINSPVRSVEIAADSVLVATTSSMMQADYVILAVPATEARRVYTSGDDLSLRLMATSYSANINIAFMTDDGFSLPAKLIDVYGLLVPRLEREYIASIGIEANKDRDRAPHGQLLNIMLSNTASQSMMSLPDDVIVRTVTPEVESFLPGISGHIEATRIYRWPQAEPYSHVGRATDLRQYREDVCSSLPRVLLAGDYMSMPYTEGAAESGKWAADRIARTHISGDAG